MNAVAITQDTSIVPVAQAAVSLGTLQAASASALVQGAREMANALADVIECQRLAVGIQGRKYVKVEGWTTLGIMLGVVPREVSTVETDGVYTAVVELVRMNDGACIGRASAECGSPDELDRHGKPVWSGRPRYARRSMAQTRATGKACRLAFSWIMALAGYEPTPAEEMPDARQQPDDGPPITDTQRNMLEARIGELGLNREGVKTWALRRFNVGHFRELNRSQFNELLAQLPRMAEIKAKREAEEQVKSEREAIQAELQPESPPEQPAQTEPEPEQPPTETQKRNMKAKAARMEKKAVELRDCRYYGGSGKTRYREAEEAAILENEARHLRHIAETA